MKIRNCGLLLGLFVLCCLFSCNGFGQLPDKQAIQGDLFPEFLVGTWHPDDSRWIFTFAADGTITKMQHFGGMEFNVAEGGLVEPWLNGAKATYILGPCRADYNPQTRQLSLEIIIEYYIINFQDGSMEGNFQDYLIGPVSEDGLTWKADWTSYGEVIGVGKTDPNKVVPKKLVFTKALPKPIN